MLLVVPFVLGVLIVSSQPLCCYSQNTDQKQLGGEKGLFQFIDYSLLLRKAGAGAQVRN